MVKKGEKKEKGKRKKPEIDRILLDNFVNLQRVLTNLAVKLDNLSDNISKLLQLFEISAKSFVEKLPGEEIKGEKVKDEEFLNKVDMLLEQNKTIAKGLTLMEEKLRERIHRPAGFPEREPRPRYPQM